MYGFVVFFNEIGATLAVKSMLGMMFWGILTDDFRINSMFEDLASNAKNLTCGGIHRPPLPTTPSVLLGQYPRRWVHRPREHRLYSARDFQELPQTSGLHLFLGGPELENMHTRSMACM